MNAWAFLFSDHVVHRLYRAQPVHPATAQRMTVDPLSGGGVRGLFSTHPSTRGRIARLLAMAH